MRTHSAEDVNRLKLIEELRKLSREEDVNLWERIAKELSRSRSNRRRVNVWKINRYTEDGETIIVPGKVLGNGVLEHPVEVAAYRFSTSAKKKIKRVGGKAMAIEDLIKENPSGSEVKIIG